MLTIEKFPKFLNGMRYSMDYTATQMTTKFLVFDLLTEKLTGGDLTNSSSWFLIASCFIANTLSTALSQVAFSYQTIASSLPINSSNRPEDVKIKLQAYTFKKKLPIDGIKYTIPVSLINTSIELFLISQVSKIYSSS